MVRRELQGAGTGILADAIGFGKTIITVALMDIHRGPESTEPHTVGGLIPSRATVIVVPPNLWHQWGQEIDKFMVPGSFRVIAAADVGVLKKCSVRDIQEADVIVLSYRIFCSPQYNQRLRRSHCSKSADVRFPVLEWFKFHRIVADEFHELISAASDSDHLFRRAVFSLKALCSQHRWGLTSTPPLRTIGEVRATASFFGEDDLPCQTFVQRMVRRNTTGLVRPEVIQHKVHVLLTRHERALYLMRERAHADHSIIPGGSSATASLLEYASLHRATAPSAGDNRTAAQMCDEELRERSHRVEEAKASLCDVILSMEARIQRLQEMIETGLLSSNDSSLTDRADVLIKTESRAATMRSLIDSRGRQFDDLQQWNDGARAAWSYWSLVCAEVRQHKLPSYLIKVVASLDAELLLEDIGKHLATEKVRMSGLKDDFTAMLMFERSLAELQESYACPICLQAVPHTECCIAPCAHVACARCWESALRVKPRCPLCRGRLELSEVHPCGFEAQETINRRALDGVSSDAPSHRLQLRAQQNSQDVQDSSSLFLQRLGYRFSSDFIASDVRGEFGTKVVRLLQTIEQIQDMQRDARILVFCQWEVLRQTIQTAFRQRAVDHAVLQGQAMERASTIKRFHEINGPKIMLLSMEASPSGLNLTLANHVILVQPTSHGASPSLISINGVRRRHVREVYEKCVCRLDLHSGAVLSARFRCIEVNAYEDVETEEQPRDAEHPNDVSVYHGLR